VMADVKFEASQRMFHSDLARSRVLAASILEPRGWVAPVSTIVQGAPAARPGRMLRSSCDIASTASRASARLLPRLTSSYMSPDCRARTAAAIDTGIAIVR
jgi:hypothetical protein